MAILAHEKPMHSSNSSSAILNIRLLNMVCNILTTTACKKKFVLEIVYELFQTLSLPMCTLVQYNSVSRKVMFTEDKRSLLSQGAETTRPCLPQLLIALRRRHCVEIF